jgi:hypothetical protein
VTRVMLLCWPAAARGHSDSVTDSEAGLLTATVTRITLATQSIAGGLVID